MGQITGRPKKAKKQEKMLGFFVTKMQYFVIQQKVAKAGVTLSDYMRQVAVYGFVKPRWTAEERDCFKKLVGLSNDLHRLVEMARKEGTSHAMLYFERYRDIIDDAIKLIHHAQ